MKFIARNVWNSNWMHFQHVTHVFGAKAATVVRKVVAAKIFCFDN